MKYACRGRGLPCERALDTAMKQDGEKGKQRQWPNLEPPEQSGIAQQAGDANRRYADVRSLHDHQAHWTRGTPGIVTAQRARIIGLCQAPLEWTRKAIEAIGDEVIKSDQQARRWRPRQRFRNPPSAAVKTGTLAFVETRLDRVTGTRTDGDRPSLAGADRERERDVDRDENTVVAQTIE